MNSTLRHGALLSLILAILFATLYYSNTDSAMSQPVGSDGKTFKGAIGLQLYSLRDQFKTDIPGTLDKVRDMGIKYVELAGTYGMPPAKFKQELDSRGLKAISGHFSYEQCRDHIDEVIAQSRLFGLEYAGCAWIPHKDPFDEKTTREAAAVFNRAGEALSKAGFKFFYHTHGYEFVPFQNGTLMDLLMAETNPKYVHFQMDVYWVVNPGHDPVKLFQKYGNRFELMHVKDMKQGTPLSLTGHSEVTNNVALGKGVIDWPSVMRAAKAAGVKWYFLEDESPSALTQIPESIQYLKTLKL
ncbi:MAG TPA: sugar phosphate isomerase/epimerase [Pyrinomonadaceae bacterium]|nr:sugar phosphate isomerase/epimerase [Pyrinomonadaceae bacterium]